MHLPSALSRRVKRVGHEAPCGDTGVPPMLMA